MQYTIVGNTEKHGTCLVLVCGHSKMVAKATLERMKTDPTENDKKLIEGFSNLRINEVDENDCWWDEE